MTTLALKTSLSALLVAAPLSGAFAESFQWDTPASPAIDRTYTSSLGTAGQETSYLRQLDARIAAAQANLDPGRDGFVDPAAAAQAQAELLDIRKAASADAQANGGAVSATTYQTLSARLQALQDTIRVATSG